jgi:hypothetical protein
MAANKLYRVTSRIRRFLNHGGGPVEVLWFVVGRRQPIGPYDKLIEDYRGEEWAAKAVNELFRASEARALKEYLLKVHGPGSGSAITVTLTALPVPIRKDALLARDVEIGGHWDFYRLFEEATYNLDFDVWGYYDASALLDVGDAAACC